MLNKVKSRFSGKYIILLFLILFIFAITFADEYNIPQKPASIDVTDIDLDGDFDIILGHDCHQGDYWGMISILKNNYNCEFTLVDTFPTFAYETSIQANKVNINEYPDIIANDYNTSIPSPVFTIINDYELFCWNYITQFCYNFITIMKYITFHSTISDLVDLVFISNVNYLWGVMYNDASGQFSEPEYYYLDYPPTDIDVGDLNGDGREDIVVSGQDVEIYFNYESGFDCYLLGDHELRVRIADVDDDGDNDIIGLTSLYAMGSTGITIYENLGYNNFIEHDQFLFQPDTGYLQVSDLNNDGLIDLICSGNYNNGIYILYNNGNSNFSEPQFFFTGEDTRKLHCEDLDNNNYNDIIALIHYTIAPDFGRLHILFNDGNGNFVEEPQVGINEECIMNNEKFKLTNYPNPFNPETMIELSIKENETGTLTIYNMKGQLLETYEYKAGNHELNWDAAQYSSGIYFYKLETQSYTETKKMIMLK